MTDAQKIYDIFYESIIKWHEIDAVPESPYDPGTIEDLLFVKNTIDTRQWHLEDDIRRPDIPDAEVVKLKREIDASNQARTDMVEKLEDFYFAMFKDAKQLPTAGLNTETPGWALDRLSILALKIFHMAEQARREDASGV